MYILAVSRSHNTAIYTIVSYQYICSNAVSSTGEHELLHCCFKSCWTTREREGRGGDIQTCIATTVTLRSIVDSKICKIEKEKKKPWVLFLEPIMERFFLKSRESPSMLKLDL